jgi:hypothetical protein
VSVISVNLDRQHFTRHGLHTNNRGEEKMCQQVAGLVQWELGAVVNAIPLEYKEDTVHEEAAGNQGNETEKTSVDPSPNCMVPSAGDQQQEVRMSTRTRRPPVKLSKDFL